MRNLRVSFLPLGLQNTFASLRVSDIRQAMIAQQKRMTAASERLVQWLMDAVIGYNSARKPLKIGVAKRKDANPPGGKTNVAKIKGVQLGQQFVKVDTTRNPPGGKTNVAKIKGVQLGQQFVKVDTTRNPPPVWEVNSIHPGIIGITHAGLKNLDDPVDMKTVSFSALLDKTYYRLVSDVGAAT